MSPPITPDDEMLMAYADGELDPLNAKRVERAMAEDPAVAAIVEQHRALRGTFGRAFAPVLDEPVPGHLAAILNSNVVAFAPLPVPAARPPRRWLSGLAVAAALVAGIAVGTQWAANPVPVATGRDGRIASGPLARALDTQLASTAGDTRMLTSFRESSGRYCRLFSGQSFDGIACKGEDGWQLRQTQQHKHLHQSSPEGDYRQAASQRVMLAAAAQEMMAGDPLDEAGEKAAAAKGWR